MPSPSKPLEGIVVLDLTQNLPGPYCSRLLQDMGARILKIEPPPAGDSGRQASALFNALNYNKESLCLNLKEEAGREILYRLLPQVHVFLEGFRPGVCEQMGLGYEQLRTYQPQLIYCRISGYGQTGPYQKYPAHDLNLQSLSGFCQFASSQNTNGVESPLPIADFSSSFFAALAIVSALYRKEQTQQGEYIDIAMSEGLFHWVSFWNKTVLPSQQIEESIEKILQKKTNSPLKQALLQKGWMRFKSKWIKRYQRPVLQLLPHYGLFKTADQKQICLGIVFEDHFWKKLCEKLGTDWTPFADYKMLKRILKGGLLRKKLQKTFLKKTLAHWLNLLPMEELPVSPVYTLEEAHQDPQFRARSLFFELQGEVLAYNPISRVSPPSFLDVADLGKNNENILTELNYKPEEIETLYQKNILFKSLRPSDPTEDKDKWLQSQNSS